MITAENPSRLLASAAPPEDTDSGCQCLTFTSAGTLFAVEISGIKEIIQYTRVTEVPMMPPQIRGVINLRGQVVPVVDLAVRFGREASALGRRSCVVILELLEGGERYDIGVLVDSVSEVMEIAPEDMAPPPGFGTAIQPEFIRHMVRLEDGFVIVLDVSRTFDARDMVALAASVPEVA
ncbi:MAG: purine-binding chemotaxis protein CheW [Gammaproteobacteria bacterium]|nr:purine-binding chemotaxis protein CheW [Gammaproteobacteria bacterium]TVS09521.1 MAG: purine-binding chemotaxis protein CheW [Gammaproteobacteria bacterium]